MKKILIGLVCCFMSVGVVANANQNQQSETKTFPTMAKCLKWLDVKFPNQDWHNGNGAVWELFNDTSEFVDGATYSSRLVKEAKAVYFRCEYKVTGTRGVFYEGSYVVDKS